MTADAKQPEGNLTEGVAAPLRTVFVTDTYLAALRASPLHPYCNACGWRKGGLDSWDGKRCKCGHSEPSFSVLLHAWNQAQTAIAKAEAA